MIKKILIFLCLFISFFAHGGEEELTKIIKKTYPELPIKGIQKTEFNDLYEVYIGGQIIYTNDNFDFLIVYQKPIHYK